LSRSEATYQNLESGVTHGRFGTRPRQYLHREAIQGLDIEAGDSAAVSGNGTNQVMSQAARRHDNAHRQREIVRPRCQYIADLFEQSSFGCVGAPAGDDAGMCLGR
jgi:hypothetical protein